MRIVSLVPSATEMLFALGLGPELVAVTHECDYPAAARQLPKVTRDVLPAGLSSAEIDATVKERTLAGESIYELDAGALHELAPDLIVTQALCSVCAVSYDDVRAVAEEIDSHTGRHLGNFPQAFTHVAFMNAARHVTEAGAPAYPTLRTSFRSHLP